MCFQTLKLRTRLAWLSTVLWLLLLLAPRSFWAAPVGADAVVLVNSTSGNYADFQHWLQPYLDNFGVPYTVLDIATQRIGPDISRYAVIIVGHSQLDSSGAYLDANAQGNLLAAISNGTGLVNFDGQLASASGLPRYPFIQSIFGFSYGAGGSANSVVFPATGPDAQMHFITARHQPGEIIPFRSGLALPGLTLPANVTALVLSGSQPLVSVTQFGQGRAVQWSSCNWVATSVLGPLEGLDDVVWRSIVWAARKPFVMRSLPNFVTLRVDDVAGDSGASPFWWVRAANSVGFKPWLSLFLSSMDETKAADLRNLVTNGLATTSIHSFDCCNTFFYWNWAANTPNSDSVVSNNFYIGTQWHQSHGIPISKVVIPHYDVTGINAFAGLKAWGVEFTMFYHPPGTPFGEPWLPLGPYRRYEPPQASSGSLPFFYADFLSLPGHPELDGQFFDCTTEIRDDAACNEWCPADNDLAGSIGRGTRQLKRALDSKVLATLYTHEWYYIYLPQKQLTISPANWLSMLQGITNNLAPYSPLYVTLDYACQYVRATRTSRLVSSAYDPVSGQLSVTLDGKTDLDTLVYAYVGEDNAITNYPGTVPAFVQPQNLTLWTLKPPFTLKAIPEITSVTLSNGLPAITWSSLAGNLYRLQFKDRLSEPNWSDLLPDIAATNLSTTVSDPLAPLSRRFYRVLLVRP